MGFRTVAVDNRPAGRQLATEMKNQELLPDLVVDSTDTKDASSKIYEFTEGEGLAAVVVCTDSIAANAWALTLLRIQGVLAVLGLPVDKWQFDSEIIVFRELMIRGSYVADTESTERMMGVVEKHNVQSHLTVIPFDDIPRVVDMYRQESFRGRLVVQIQEETSH